MKESLDHLPDDKQRELARIVEILLEEMDNLNGNASPKKKKLGRIDKIILFGSHTGDKWMDDLNSLRGVGYQSDYDILAVVNYEKFAEPGIWTPANDRFIHTADIEPPVQLIVHSRHDVTSQLREGRYFFKDIRREGIVLYDAWHGRKPLPEPGDLSPREVYKQARAYFEYNKKKADRFYKHFCIAMNDREYVDASFQLHQSTEFAYRTHLLTYSLYMPKGHNLEVLRSLAEQYDADLIEAWPRGQKPYDRYFDQLNRAYVEARYSPHFEMIRETAEWLGERNAILRDKVCISCDRYLTELKQRL